MARQERALRTRRQILDAAGAVFAERGYQTATVLDFLSYSGVTRGAFYFHFSSKEDVALTLLSEQGPQHDLLATQKHRLQELADVSLVLATRLRHDPWVRGGFQLSVEQGPDGRYRREPFVERARFNQELLTSAREQGELSAHVDVRDTAEFLVSTLMGLQMMSQVICDYSDLERRIASLLRNVMSRIALPDVLAELDLAPDRGVRLLRENGQLPAAATELTSDQAS